LKHLKEIGELKEAARKHSASLDFLMVSLRLLLLNQDPVTSSNPFSNEDRMHLRISELSKAEDAMAAANSPKGNSAATQQPAITLTPQSTINQPKLDSFALAPASNLKRKRTDGEPKSSKIRPCGTKFEASVSKKLPKHKTRWNSAMEFHGENKARSVMLIVFKHKEGSWAFDGEIKQKDAIP